MWPRALHGRVGNVTGVTDLHEELHAKRVEILQETIPSMRRLAVLANPNQPGTVEYIKAVNVAAARLV